MSDDKSVKLDPAVAKLLRNSLYGRFGTNGSDLEVHREAQKHQSLSSLNIDPMPLVMVELIAYNKFIAGYDWAINDSPKVKILITALEENCSCKATPNTSCVNCDALTAFLKN